ncbi:MAG: excinuclease ABC subunit UvrA [Anaerolineaceae bacterium]
MSPNEIIIRGARMHNLKNINLSIPKNKLVVFTGLSGSGKSTLAFDTLYKEGARQFMESLGLVTDGMSKPQVDMISGLSPSISVDQHPGNRNPRSTVGTATELFTYLRVLYARLGHRPCPKCGQDVPPALNLKELSIDENEENAGEGDMVACPHCGSPLPEISMTNFSFNKPAGACPTCTGLGVMADIILEKCFDPTKSLKNNGVLIWDPFNAERFLTTLQRAGQHYGFTFDIDQPIGDLGAVQHDLLFYGVNSKQFTQHFPTHKPPSTVLKGNFEGVITNLKRRYTDGLTESGLKVKLDTLFARQTCPDCKGTRLCLESRQVKVNGCSIIEISQMSLEGVAAWIQALTDSLSEEERLIAGPVVVDLMERLSRLITIGVGYLTMDRSYPSLSAGEGQRLRLAALLGSGLTGVLYVLDEPTIGLHQRDTTRLIKVLRQLRDLGNTVLVIEHDIEMIESADYVIEFGPGAGKYGGEIVIAGTPAEITTHPTSITGKYLSNRRLAEKPHPRNQSSHQLVINGAKENNLKDICVSIPLERLVAVTGVSGSGKSSLVFDILDRAARCKYYGASEPPGKYQSIEGWEYIDRVVTVDQSPIGRIPRSNAATYTEVFTSIREVFASVQEARQRNLTSRHFSFNVPGGRCERCEGAGVLSINMHFLPDIQVRCPVCHGMRFKKEILAVKHQGVNIAQVLDMSIDDALNLFNMNPEVVNRLKILSEVGLGYLQLGQPATTLSGGEAQRVKLAKELSRGGKGHTLYLLDEPTTGLHLADITRLLLLLQRLVDTGNTVIVVEHNLELVAAVDWVIDLGPEGGNAGGQLLAAGTPLYISQFANTITGQCLKQLLSV